MTRPTETRTDADPEPVVPTKEHRPIARMITVLCCILSSLTNVVYANVCPQTPEDLVIEVAAFDPPPAAGEPEMSVTGLFDFVRDKGIASIADLLSALPDHYNKNYSLVETTRTPGHASLEFPKIVLFGSDARFMMNIATDPADPDYERMDVSFMNKDSGDWEFAQFDFTTSPARLDSNPVSCAECHGNPARPFWGTYLNWPGVMGDDPAPGDQPETLTPAHAQRFNELKAGLGNAERFHTLKWADEYLEDGALFLPDNAYGFAMTILNKHLGFIVAESIYLRMKKKFPREFRALREELLLLGYFDRRTDLLQGTERRRIEGLIAHLGGRGDTVDDLFAVLGIDTDNEFSLHRLATETPDQRWNVSSGDIEELVYFLVLYDLVESDPQVGQILASVPIGEGVEGIWTCPDLGETTLDVLKYKYTQGWKLKGVPRQELHETFFGIDVDRMYQPIFDRITDPLYAYLRTKISSADELGGSPPDTRPGPPTVTAVRTFRGDGALTECESLDDRVFSLDVRFSEHMATSTVVDDANWRLIAAGRNHDIETETCRGLAGDDIAVGLSALTYDVARRTATLTVDGSATMGSLADAPYRLMACATLTDGGGSALDGDSDGTAGEDFVRTFRVDVANAFRNGHFDCSVDDGWTGVGARPTIDYSASMDVDDARTSGAAAFSVDRDDELSIEQCVDIHAGAWQFDGSVLVDTPGRVVNVIRTCEIYSEVGCSGDSLSVQGSNSRAPSSDRWKEFGGSLNVPGGAHSALCDALVSERSGRPFNLFLDSLSLEPVERIFTDSFETGDLSEWTEVEVEP